MPKETATDIVITVPATTAWSEYEQELARAAAGETMNYRVTRFPVKAQVGSKCYVVYRGVIRGYMIITGFSEKTFTCTSTGKRWTGRFIERSGPFTEVRAANGMPAHMASFRGFRYAALSVVPYLP